MKLWLWRILFVLFLSCFSTAWAIPGLNKLDSVKAELISRTDSVQPGAILQAGILLKHKPKWHTYWKASGDTGYPTSVSWTLPPGWKASEIQWPMPKLFKVGQFINYGYEGEVLLPISIEVPRDALSGSVENVSADVSWLMCEDQCVPGSAKLTLPVKVSSASPNFQNDSLFEQTDKLIPGKLDDVKTLLDPEKGWAVVSFKTSQTDLDDFYLFAEGDQSILYGAPQKVFKTQDGFAIAVEKDQLKAGDKFAGLIVANEGPRAGGWAKSFEGILTEEKFVPGAPVEGHHSPASFGALLAVGMAFLGGLILNLMPCVFPVLSLKVIGIVKNRNDSMRQRLAHGGAFSAGVLVTMCFLAGILIFIKSTGASIGWGFQLQSAWFVAALYVLFLAITLNLLGAFEFTLGSRMSLSSKEGSTLSNSFSTGILAVVVASPCTAPFMGAALGYALTASNFVSFLIFVALGLGMALPWVLLTTVPALTAWLPKPGMWMIRFRQLMAVPMLLTALWLLWVLFQQVPESLFMLFFLSGILGGFALVFLGKVQFGKLRFRKMVALFSLFALLSYGSATYLSTHEGFEAAQNAGSWSEENVLNAIADGHPVFVDFTASWCVTCQANKVGVLLRSEVQKAFEKNNVKFLVGDWTNRNAEIAQALEKFGRSGVPLYLMYSPDGSVQVLPELLTINTVLEAVEKAVKK